MSEIIHTDHNGVTVEHIADSSAGSGHVYYVRGEHFGTHIEFQTRPVKEVGTNGLTNEALLAILIHRTQTLNDNFPCHENSIAIIKMQEALMWFEKRTADRLARQVEGENKA